MQEWYFQTMGQELGPFSAAELKTKVDNGQIQFDTMVRRGVDGKWLFAERVKGLLPPPPEPVLPKAAPAKSKSSATMPLVDDSPVHEKSDLNASVSVKGSATSNANRQMPLVAISLDGDGDQADSARAPSAEFYDFVGFREAISPVLHQAVRQYLTQQHLTMTQLNRRALATFIARPELAGDLMISNVAVLPQPVNDKSNADRSHPLADSERNEHATFRLTLFNSSSHPVEVTHGEFVPESVEIRDYDEVGTKVLPGMDHKGHVSIKLDGVQAESAIPLTLKTTVLPLAAATVTVWFRASNKPSLTKIRGQLRLGEGDESARSEVLTVIMHGDSQ